MYIVVSKWKTKDGRTEEFESRGRPMRALMRSMPGVAFAHGMRTDDGDVVAMIGYNSKSDYDRIVTDPNGPFAKAAAEHGLDEVGEWVWSERGESVDD